MNISDATLKELETLTETALPMCLLEPQTTMRPAIRQDMPMFTPAKMEAFFSLSAASAPVTTLAARSRDSQVSNRFYSWSERPTLDQTTRVEPTSMIVCPPTRNSRSTRMIPARHWGTCSCPFLAMWTAMEFRMCTPRTGRTARKVHQQGGYTFIREGMVTGSSP